MRKQSTRTIKNRRRKGKTNYKARFKLLKSPLPRIIIRKTNRYINAQYAKSEQAQDFVIAAASSKELLGYGWKKEHIGSLKSLPACYLTGLLLGKKIKKANKESKAILDIGLHRNVKKSRIYAVLKGLIDTGLEIKYKKEVFPDEKRIRGEHLKNKIDFEKIKENILK